MQSATQLMAVLAHLSASAGYKTDATKELLKALLQKNPAYTRLAILSSHGESLCSVPSSTIAENYSDTKWFNSAVSERQLVVGGFQIGAESGKPELPLVYPVFHDNEELEVVIYVALDLTWLTRLRQESIFPLSPVSPSSIAQEPSWCGIPIPNNGSVRLLPTCKS